MNFKHRRWRFIGFGLLIGAVIIGGLFWWYQAFQPIDKNATEKKQKTFVIRKSESLEEISRRLEEEDLIQSSFAFKVYVLVKGLPKKIQAGEFRLYPGMNLEEIANQLIHGTLDIWVTIPEGWRSEQIAQELSKKGFNIDIESWELEIKNLAYEGYLFPDTYLFPRGASLEEIIEIMRKNFDQKFDSRLKAELTKKELTINQVLVLASIVEREVKLGKDRPIVAGILVKRWKNDWPLQVDATIQYAVASTACGKLSFDCEWWPKGLTGKDFEIESSFNSYKNKGLPLAPICNPGLESIKAVLYWQESPYWFYLSDRDGKIHFAQTIQEHQANIFQFLR